MYAFRDQNGKILALCIHFRTQSGDSGCMARESCHQGPFFASRARKSRMARRCCQRCPDFRGVPRAAGLRTGRTGFVPCGPGLVRLPHARVSTILPAPPHRPHRGNQPGSAAACITLAALSTPIVATRIAHRSRREWRAAATRARGPPPIAAARICRVLAPRPPPALPATCAPAPSLAPAACASRCLRPPSAPRTAANEQNRAANSMRA